MWWPASMPRSRSARASRRDRSSSSAKVVTSRLVPITIAGASGVWLAHQLGVISAAMAAPRCDDPRKGHFLRSALPARRLHEPRKWGSSLTRVPDDAVLEEALDRVHGVVRAHRTE